MIIDQRKAFSAKKHFAPDLRKAIGTDDLEKFEANTLTWDQLHTARQALHTLCEKAISQAESRNDVRWTQSVGQLDGVAKL